jgi:hypothetical protein
MNGFHGSEWFQKPSFTRTYIIGFTRILGDVRREQESPRYLTNAATASLSFYISRMLDLSAWHLEKFCLMLLSLLFDYVPSCHSSETSSLYHVSHQIGSLLPIPEQEISPLDPGLSYVNTSS